ncbi:MAG: AbrB/MazE/SpoVT family DNA-binding domain-containing protein [Symbiobacteriaceae bacterium]|nr:AbrB/MazE/SpoVT family DNA-binding domain-containing protein [Symbiobacteriaceae bacterium]
MHTEIKKWGNSAAIRLPKELLALAGLSVDQPVLILVEDECIVIQKSTQRNHKTLKQRLMGFDGKYIGEEWDTGVPVGREVW